jgi:hypothetical protein
MSSSGTSNSASEAAKNFFSKTQVIYVFNFLQNLIVAAVVTAVYTSIMLDNGQIPSLNQVTVPIDTNSMNNMTYEQVVTTLDSHFSFPRGPPSVIMAPDAMKAGYSMDILRKFLNESGPINVPYRAEAFDCDDFALVMLGRERAWFGSMSPQSVAGSTFAYISGDLRLNNETSVAGHAMNAFIDNYSQVWLIEPQTREIFKSNKLSQDSRVDYIIM